MPETQESVFTVGCLVDWDTEKFPSNTDQGYILRNIIRDWGNGPFRVLEVNLRCNGKLLLLKIDTKRGWMETEAELFRLAEPQPSPNDFSHQSETD